MKQTEAVKGSGMERPMPAGAGNSGEQTEDLKQLDEAALNDPKLLTSVEERLANLNEMTRPERGSQANPAAEPEEAEEEPTEEEEQKDDPQSAEPPAREGKSPEPDSPTLDEGKGLPEAYVRAAVAYGWKKEDAEEFYRDNPERALTVLSSIYQTRNRASAEFAALGRRATEQRQAPKTEEKPGVDVAALRAQYGEDAKPLLDIIESQGKQLAIQPKPQPVATPGMSPVEQSGVEEQVHQYFQSDAMKPYEKVYGRMEFGQTWDDLTASQRQFRWSVIQKADQIAGGAQLQGIRMPLSEALEAAHLLVTQKYRDQVLVDGVKAKVVTRSKGLTLQPSKGTRKAGTDATETAKPGNRTREQLATDVGRKLQRMFGG
jgi:hypothetical protein